MIRMGILGCGKIAQVEHAPSLHKLRGVKIAALCDVNAANMHRIRESFAPDAETFVSRDKFLKSGLDAVSICTPNNMHCPMTVAALKAGCHVLCEKPLGGTTDDADRSVRAARKAGRILHVNQSLRYAPVYRTIADLIARGKIGTPVHARCIRSGGSTPDKGWSPGATWFVSKRSQGGVVLDIAVHMADLLRWCMGEVKEIAAFTDSRTPGIRVTDHVAAILRFDSGATASLELSWAQPAGAGLLEVYGTKGSVRMGFTDQPIELRQIRKTGQITTTPKIKTRVKTSFAAFVDAVNGKAPSPTPGELGRSAVALCEAIEESGKRREFVKVRRFRT